MRSLADRVRAVVLGLGATTTLFLPFAPMAPQKAFGQAAVACVNCATLIQQLMQYAKEAEQLSETITMRVAQAQMLQASAQIDAAKADAVRAAADYAPDRVAARPGAGRDCR